MYRITATNPNGTSYVIYDPVGVGALPVLAPRNTEELNEAGSLEFSLLVGHPAFGHLNSVETYITATLDGNELFYGRIISAEPSPLGGQIQYTAMGALGFLRDGEMAPDPKNEDGSYSYQTMTAEAFFRRCISEYNNEIGNDPRRVFTVGTVSHRDKNKEREYQLSSYTSFQDVIRQNIIDRYGGFLRIRPRQGVGHYIDWVEQYGDEDNAVLDIGQNILSITNRMNGEDFITAIRPIGRDGLVLSGSQTLDLFPDSKMAKYGKIVRSVQLNAAETQEELLSQAEALIDSMNKSLPKTSEIGLVDLHFADSSQHGVNLGDVFTHIVGLEGERMTVAARNRDFDSPQNDSVTLRNPKELEGSYDINDYKSNRTTGGNSSNTLSSQTARAGGGAGAAYKYIHETQDRLELATKHIAINAEELELHADMFVETANEFARISHTVGTLENEVGEIQGTGVIQNSEFISQLAGRFVYDPTNHRVSLVEGTEFRVTENGTQISVGRKLADLTEFQTRFEGSALWTNRDSITGVVGEFDIVTNGQGERTLRVRSGGGLSVLKNGVTMGVYDEGSLTARVVVDKINGGTATIQASKIYLLGDTIANAVTADLVKNRIGLMDSVRVKNLTVATSLTFEGSGTTITGSQAADLIRNIKIEPSGNNYKLQKITCGGGDWEDVGTFSRATTLSGVWSGGTFTVSASPQGNTISAALFSVAKADITWQGNTANIPVYANINGGETRYNTGKTLAIDATERYEAGAADSAPTSATLGTKVTGTTYNISIKRGGGFANVGSTINLASAYTDAREGYYTQTEYDDRYTEGVADGVSVSAPTGATLGTKVSGTTYNISIQRGGGYAAVAKTINLKSAYADAREGYYTTAQYNARYNAGAADSAPTSATLGTKVTGTTYNISVKRGGGFAAVGLTINLKNAYSDARSGYYTKAQYDANYNAGWNACVDHMSSNCKVVVLTGYTTYNGGASTTLYTSPSPSSAAIASGSARIWRYGGSAVTRYVLPSKK